MKKILFFLIVTLSIATQSQAQITNTVKWPWGNIQRDTLLATKSADTTAVINNVTLITINDTLHAAMSIVAVAGSRVKAGALLYIKTSCGAVARTVTFNTAYFTGVALTGTANKTKLSTFVYDGSKFLSIANTQIN